MGIQDHRVAFHARTGTPAPYCPYPTLSYHIWDEYGDLSTINPVAAALEGGAYSFQVNLEASRLGNDLDGRLYQIQLDTSDYGETNVNVIVPHDQRKK